MSNNYSGTTRRRDNRNDKDVLLKESRETMPLLPVNFRLMAIAGVMIVVGFLLMLGGSSDWGNFNADIFSSRRIVVGPTIAFLGFIFMGVAIMFTKNKEK